MCTLKRYKECGKIEIDSPVEPVFIVTSYIQTFNQQIDKSCTYDIVFDLKR